MPTLIALFGNIWFRRAALMVAAALAFFVLRQHFINEGHQQGSADQAQTDADQREKERKADRAETDQKLALLQTQIDSAKLLAAQQQALFLALATQRQQATQQVAGMTDAQVQAIVEKYTQRQLADCVTQLPLCNQQVEAKTKEVAEKDRVIAGDQQKYDSLSGYAVSLERTYVDLYNQKATAKRSWKCLRLWRCSRPRITAPNPSLLIRPKGNNDATIH